jgi:hypothetical protein
LQRAQVTGAVSEEELTRIWKALEQAEQEQHFFARVGGFWMSLLHLSCVANKPTFVAEYHVWEESRSEHEMGSNYACG